MNVQSAVSVMSAAPSGHATPAGEDATPSGDFAALIAGIVEPAKPADTSKAKPVKATLPGDEAVPVEPAVAPDASLAALMALPVLLTPPMVAEEPTSAAPELAISVATTPAVPTLAMPGEAAVAVSDTVKPQVVTAQSAQSAPLAMQDALAEPTLDTIIKHSVAAAPATHAAVTPVSTDPIKVSVAPAETPARPLVAAPVALAAQNEDGTPSQDQGAASDEKPATFGATTRTAREGAAEATTFGADLASAMAREISATPDAIGTVAVRYQQPATPATADIAIAATRPMPAAEQIATQVSRAATEGANHIRIELHPGELGAIDIRLHLGADGQVSARISAERPETLDLLQRDASGLERALQDVGLRTSDTSLSFSLRGDSRGGFAGGERPMPYQVQSGGEPPPEDMPPAVLANAYRTLGRGAIDITV